MNLIRLLNDNQGVIGVAGTVIAAGISVWIYRRQAGHAPDTRAERNQERLAIGAGGDILVGNHPITIHSHTTQIVAGANSAEQALQPPHTSGAHHGPGTRHTPDPRQQSTGQAASYANSRKTADGRPRGVYQIDKAFLQDIKATAQAVSPAEFYSFQDRAAWFGVLKDWDAARSYDTRLLTAVTGAGGVGAARTPIAAIIGAGGTGKSVSLRRLAVALSRAGHEVWWADRPGYLINGDPPQAWQDQAAGDRYLLVDDIHRLGTSDEADDLLQTASDYQCKLVVAGQRLPAKLRPLKDSDSEQLVITIDQSADLPAILDKIIRYIPAWSALAAKALKPHDQSTPRLVELLYVFAKAAKDQKLAQGLDLQQIGEAFVRIIEQELEQLQDVSPGLFGAVVDAARLQDWNIEVCEATLAGLVRRHEPGSAFIQFYKDGEREAAWRLIHSFMALSNAGVMRFHHAVLASKVIEAVERKAADDEHIFGPATERSLLKHIVLSGAEAEASYALLRLATYHAAAIGKQQLMSWLDRLIDAGNGHHAYQQILHLPAMPLTAKERLQRVVKLSRSGRMQAVQWVWKTTKRSRSGRRKLLQALITATTSDTTAPQYRDEALIGEYIKYLPAPEQPAAVAKFLKGEPLTDTGRITVIEYGAKKASQAYARTMLQTPGTSLAVRAACVKRLEGQTQLAAARQLVDESLQYGKDEQAFQVSIQALGPEGVQRADQALLAGTLPRPWRAHCVLRGGEGAAYYAASVLQQALETTVDPELLTACIMKAGVQNLRTVAGIVRMNRHTHVAAVSLKLLVEESEAEAAAVALELLTDDSTMPEALIIQCLRAAKQQAKAYARHKLTHEAELSRELRMACLDVIGDQQRSRAYALQELHQWRGERSEPLNWYLENAGDSSEAAKIVKDIYEHWSQVGNSRHRKAALSSGIHPKLQRQRALTILKAWRREFRPVVSVALAVLGEDPAAVLQPCTELLRDWRKEIQYSKRFRDRSLKDYDGHLQKALAHPQLNDMAAQVAAEMLEAEKQQPGMLSSWLRRKAEAIVTSNISGAAGTGAAGRVRTLPH